MKLKIAVSLTIGILAGAALVQIFHATHDLHRQELFAQKLKCKNLADNYVKTNTSSFEIIFLDRNDFSASRNSCIASASVRSGGHTSFDVVDVITGEILFTGSCNEKDANSPSFCGNGKDIALMEQRDREFDK